MSPKSKLIFIFILTALFVSWHIQILILFLNHNAPISHMQLLDMFANLILFYGPLWLLFLGTIFFLWEFFSERQVSTGFFSPPTLIYLFLCAVLVVFFLFYSNFNYYSIFLVADSTHSFQRLLLFELLAAGAGFISIWIKGRSKPWVQMMFVVMLGLEIAFSFQLLSRRTISQKTVRPTVIPTVSPRTIKLVIMEGLSLNFILTQSVEKKLPNFEWIRENGVVCRIKTFKPNYELSLLSTLLTGLHPSRHPFHAQNRFQFRDLETEFDLFPRYIFLRKMPLFNLATFYSPKFLDIPDHLQSNYQANRFSTVSLLQPPDFPIYSEKTLQKNNLYLQLFSDIPPGYDPKFNRLKKSFFLDEFLERRIPNFKANDIRYFILKLPGLETVTSHFYHYAIPQNFVGLKEEWIAKYGEVMERYYLFYDSIIGKLIAAMGDNELLAVVSFYEPEPLPIWRRTLLKYFGKKDVFIYQPASSPGVIMMYEKKALKKMLYLDGVSIFNIFPTLLYYSRFPIPHDLQGEVVSEIFTDQFLYINKVETSPDLR